MFVGLTLLTLLLIAGPVAVKALPNSYSPLSPHKPIVIDGNGGFTLDNGVTIGNGTVSNPYVIEGLDISQGSLVCAFYDGCGLNVRNTDAYFVIRNTYVHVPSYGVVFYNVENGIIENSIVSDNGLGGIEVIGSSYITVLEDNITQSRDMGIKLNTAYDIGKPLHFKRNPVRSGTLYPHIHKLYCYN